MPSVVRARRSSAASDADPYEATRFHEFASSEEERDDWVQEQTCHRNRLTVDDTLKVENRLRKLGKEVDEEVLEEEEDGGELQKDLISVYPISSVVMGNLRFFRDKERGE